MALVHAGVGPTQPEKQIADAGLDFLLIPAFWDRLQTADNGELVPGQVETLKDQIDKARAEGLEVLFQVAFHYPPPWAKTLLDPFVDQFGNEWAGGAGDDIRDWVWSSTGRVKVAGFIDVLFAALGPAYLSKIWAIRLGGGPFGELGFPNPGSAPFFSLWGFGAAPQLGIDLAFDQTIAPHLGPWATQEMKEAWIGWFHSSLDVFVTWLIAAHRTYWKGPIFVLHPSFGIRDNWEFDSVAYQQAAAEGQDWRRFVTSYASEPGVYPWSTWADRLDVTVPPVLDSDKAPFRKLWELSTAEQKQGIGGENTGTYNLNLFDPDGAIALGYASIMWITWDSLTIPLVQEALK